MKPQKIVILSLIVICVTLLLFTWITRAHLALRHPLYLSVIKYTLKPLEF
ncbi:Hok/Gef family protein [Photorhabdus sp. RM323S]